ncbi:MAG: SRPBCC family protein [Verrucomicrobiota bacterium]
MPAFGVSKSIQIDAPVERVFEVVRDFKQWPNWSPWLICDPETKLEFADDGNRYAWDGKITGTGEIAVIGETPLQEILYALTFLKPWKSEADVAFRFQSMEGGTEVTWEMNSSLPFFMGWMKDKMTAMLCMDYQRGLTMLKDWVEMGSVPSTLDYSQRQHDAVRYVGLATTCEMANLGEAMEADVEKLAKVLEEASVEVNGSWFSIYETWDLGKGMAGYVMGAPVSELPTPIPDGLVSGIRPAARVYEVSHTGPYRHLGNAWSSGMMRGRYKVFAMNKKIPPYEIYETHPKDIGLEATSESEVKTTVCFPTK